MFDIKPQPEESTTAQNRKTFGMTQTQITILAGLAGAACLLFAVAGFLVLQGRGRGGAAPVSPSTPVPQFTVTPFAIPTLTPTETLTPVPYEMLIPQGWVQFKTGLVELWLPKEFKISKTKTLGNSVNLATPELVATGVSSKASTYKMIAVVSYEPMTTDSLDSYLTGEISNLPADTRVADRRMVTMNSQDVVRLVFEQHGDKGEFNELMYVFLDGTTVWYVEYVAQINEYFTMLDTFEKSAKTFRIVK